MFRRLAVTAALALLLVPTAHAAYGLDSAYRITGVTTLCFNNQETLKLWKEYPSDWAAGAMYFPTLHVIGLQAQDCWDLNHWRTADPYNLTDEIFTLGHEWTHYQQQMQGKPFDEHEADCGGLHKWFWLKHRLGIERHLRLYDATWSHLNCP